MTTIHVPPEFPLNRRMRKAVRRGKLRVVREGGERSGPGGGGGKEMSPSDFVERLAAVRLNPETVFNPYSDTCPCGHDLPNAPKLRRKNLTAVLTAAMSVGPVDLWVGQEPGHRGARRTGLALTDDDTLPRMSEMFGVELEKATRTSGVREGTAQAAWGILLQLDLDRLVFPWNVFPFHSHKPGKPLSCRGYISAERRVGEGFLRDAINLLQPRQNGRIVAIGCKARDALNEMGIEADFANHPSHHSPLRENFPRQIGKIYGADFDSDWNKIPKVVSL